MINYIREKMQNIETIEKDLENEGAEINSNQGSPSHRDLMK